MGEGMIVRVTRERPRCSLLTSTRIVLLQITNSTLVLGLYDNTFSTLWLPESQKPLERRLPNVCFKSMPRIVQSMSQKPETSEASSIHSEEAKPSQLPPFGSFKPLLVVEHLLQEGDVDSVNRTDSVARTVSTELSPVQRPGRTAWNTLAIRRAKGSDEEGINLRWDSSGSMAAILRGVHTSVWSRLAEGQYERLKEGLKDAARTRVSVSRLLNSIHLSALGLDYLDGCERERTFEDLAGLRLERTTADTLYLASLRATGCVSRRLREWRPRLAGKWHRMMKGTHQKWRSEYQNVVALCNRPENATSFALRKSLKSFHRKLLDGLRRAATELPPIVSDFRELEKVREAIDTLTASKKKGYLWASWVKELDEMSLKWCGGSDDAIDDADQRMLSAPLPFRVLENVKCSWEERIRAFMLSTMTLATHDITVREIDESTTTYELTVTPHPAFSEGVCVKRDGNRIALMTAEDLPSSSPRPRQAVVVVPENGAAAVREATDSHFQGGVEELLGRFRHLYYDLRDAGPETEAFHILGPKWPLAGSWRFEGVVPRLERQIDRCHESALGLGAAK